MSKYTAQIIDYFIGEMSKKEESQFEYDLRHNADLEEEFNLHGKLFNFLRARLDIEEIENDEAQSELESYTKSIIEDYYKNKQDSDNIKTFIINAIKEKRLRDEITEIEKEIIEKNVDKVTHNWAKTWKETKAKNKKPDQYDKELDKYVRNAMRKKDNKILHSFKIVSYSMIKKWYYAAAILATLIVSTLYINKLSVRDYNAEKLFARYYMPLEAISFTQRTVDQDINTTFLNGMTYYKNKEYVLADKIFTSLLNKKIEICEAYLFSGLSKIETGNYSSAIKTLNKVIEKYDEYELEAQWYLALCYLKTGEIDKSLSILNKLANNKSIYQHKAKKILNKIR